MRLESLDFTGFDAPRNQVNIYSLIKNNIFYHLENSAFLKMLRSFYDKGGSIMEKMNFNEDVDKILETPYRELSLRQQAIKKSIIYALLKGKLLTDPSVKGYMQGYIAAALHIITSVMAYGEDKEQICKMMEIAPEDYDRLYYFFKPLDEE